MKRHQVHLTIKRTVATVVSVYIEAETEAIAKERAIDLWKKKGTQFDFVKELDASAARVAKVRIAE